MATLTLIVVIVFLTANLAILYLPFDKTKRAMLSAISVGLLTVCGLAHGAWNNEIPVHICEKIKHAPNVEAQRSMMATFNVSEEMLNNHTAAPAEMPTPIEFGMAFVVTVILIAALVFTPLLLLVARNDDDATAKKVHRIAFSLNILASGFLLSLYYGLELPILPWIKKTSETKRVTSSPVLQ